MFVSNKYTLVSVTFIVALTFLTGGCSSSEHPPPTPATDPTVEALPSPTKPAETSVESRIAETPTGEPIQVLEQAGDSLAVEEPAQASNQAGDSLAESTTVPPEIPAEPTPLSESVAISLPDLTREQEVIFTENLISMLNTASYENGGVLDDGALEPLAGPFLVQEALDPNWLDRQSNYDPDFQQKIQPLIDYVNSMNQGQKNKRINQALRDYGLRQGTPFQLQVSSGETLAKYDPASGFTTLTITIPRPEELSVPEAFQGEVSEDGTRVVLNQAGLDQLDINAESLDVLTLQPTQMDIPLNAEDGAEAVFTVEDSILYGQIQKLAVTLPGNLLRWSQINVGDGLLVDATEGDTSAQIFFTKGLTVNDQVMDIRALHPSEFTAQKVLPSNLYGGEVEELLDPIPESELADAMAAEVDRTMDLHVAAGNITQEEADAIVQDPRLEDLHPVYQAALQIGSLMRSVGGEHLVDSVMGENHSELPLTLLFESDTDELNEIFDGDPPSVNGNNALLWHLPDDSAPQGYRPILILNDKFKHGEEPVQLAAAIMAHETILHDRFDPNQWNSLSEETVGSLINLFGWRDLLLVDPELAFKGTPSTKFMNMRMFAFLNTLYPEGARRHIGVGLRSQYAPDDYSIFPNHQMDDLPPMKSFVDLMEFLMTGQSGSGVDLSDVSWGSENTRLILETMFANHPEALEEIEHLDLNEDDQPDFSNLLINFLDKNLHLVFTNDEAAQIAQLMNLTLKNVQ